MTAAIIIILGACALLAAVIVTNLLTRRSLAAREARRPISAYQHHRQKWLQTGDPAELDAMNQSLNEEEQ